MNSLCRPLAMAEYKEINPEPEHQHMLDNVGKEPSEVGELAFHDDRTNHVVFIEKNEEIRPADRSLIKSTVAATGDLEMETKATDSKDSQTLTICKFMEPKDRRLLNELSRKLSEECNFDNLLAYLKMTNLFTENGLKIYERKKFKKQTEELKCQTLFLHIQTRGRNALWVLLDCFQKTGHSTQYKILSRHLRGRVASATDKANDKEEIVVKKSIKIYGPSQTVYKMTSVPRGYYIFINNIEFETHPERVGANFDKAFENILINMGFKGSYHTNQTKKDMWHLLTEFAAREDLSTVDSLFVVISSHGEVTSNKELIICPHDDVDEADDPVIEFKVISLFNKCKLPQGQPKIFCINVCRDANGRTPGRLVNKRNQWKDIFYLASCDAGRLSNRFPEYGSWIFIALVEVFKDYACNTDLECMKEKINQTLAEFKTFAGKTTNDQKVSLNKFGVPENKRLFFNPGL